MTYPPPVLGPAVEPGFPSHVAVGALVDTLISEKRLLEELLAIVRRQRAAVAGNDLQAVEDSVYATHRVLLTLGEARKRRHSLKRMLGYPEGIGVSDLEAEPGAHASPPLRRACEELRETAQRLSHDVEISRAILREALIASDEYVRSLCGASETPLLYPGDGHRSDAEFAGGTLINRRV